MSDISSTNRASVCFDLAAQRDEGINAAREALADGKLVVLPTDTVYGIAADAFQPAAVQALLDAKHRGRDMPPPVLIAEPAMLGALVSDVPVEVESLINRFWPGALTLIMKAQPMLTMDLGKTEGTIAVRVPDQADTRALLSRTGPLAVSSANISGQLAAKTISEAMEQLGDCVAVYLDGGTSAEGLASTIIDLVGDPHGRIVRTGALSYQQLAQILPQLSDAVADSDVEGPSDA